MSKIVPLDAHGTKFSRLNPGLNYVAFTSFSEGRLDLEGGCFRLVKPGSSLTIVWPETSILVAHRGTIRIEDHAARWSAGVGDRIRLGGKTSNDISAVDLNNSDVRSCAGPFFIASNVILRRGS